MRNSYAPYFALFVIALFFGLLVWLDSPSAYTQADPATVRQLTNQHTAVASSYPTHFIELNGAAYFGIASEKGGLWKTDGTAQGTLLVKDLIVAPYSLQRIGDLLYFTAHEDGYNAALWKSDGSAEGTVLLKSNLGGFPSTLVAVGAIVYFSAYDPIHGSELWQSDGTPAGTRLVADVKPGSDGISPDQLVASNNLLYFVGYDEGYRRKLWQSDGTPEGTHVVTGAPDYPNSLLVMQDGLYFVGYDEAHGYELWRYAPGDQAPSLVFDIAPGSQSAAPDTFVVVNNRLFFAASNAEQGRELWQSDGTAAGTQLVKELAPGPTDASLANLTNVNGLLYFTALGSELWQSDGTAQGTLLVKAIAPGFGAYGLTEMNGLLYFLVAGDQSSLSLWKSDGTAVGTVAIAELLRSNYYYYRNFLTAIGNRLYFSASDATHGSELWASDGTAAGTAFVKDLNPGYLGSNFSKFTRVNNRLYFTTSTGNFFYGEEEQLWLSDGTTLPATLLNDQLGSYQLQGVGDTLFVGGNDATGPALWKHQGAASALELVKRFAKQSPFGFIVLNNQLFFVASDQTNESGYSIYDFWRSDGTAAGTIKLVAGSATGSYFGPQVVFNGRVFVTRHNEIWVLDGTAQGTTHFVPAGLQDSIIRVVSTPNALYFTTAHYSDLFTQVEAVWRSDGTPLGTHHLTSEPEVSYIAALFPVDNALYLVGGSRELWYSDGNSLTLNRLAGLTPALYYANFSDMTLANGQVFFTADDGVHGPELWKSNGTPEGTVLVKDSIPPELADVPSAYPGPLFEFGDLLYLGINDGVHGRELWQSNGTAEGTLLFKDINPGAGDSWPRDFIGGTKRFFFSAYDAVHGRELWQSDGTVVGTTLVTDLYSGAASAGPMNRLSYSDTLFFTANNGLDGQQLFALDPAVPLALPGEEEPPLPLPNHFYLPLVKQ